jgi:hypothetical protein
MRLKIILGSIVALAILVAGCGSSGDGTSSESTSSATEASKTSVAGLSPKTQFKYQVNEICLAIPVTFEKGKKALEKEFKEEGKGSPSIAEINLKAAVPPLYTAIERFEELTPLEGDEEEMEAITDALRSAARGMEAKPTSSFGGPLSPFVEFAELTKEGGFESCARL